MWRRIHMEAKTTIDIHIWVQLEKYTLALTNLQFFFWYFIVKFTYTHEMNVFTVRERPQNATTQPTKTKSVTALATFSIQH